VKERTGGTPTKKKINGAIRDNHLQSFLEKVPKSGFPQAKKDPSKERIAVNWAETVPLSDNRENKPSPHTLKTKCCESNIR